MATATRIPAKSLARALAFVGGGGGGRLCVRTAVRCTVIDAATVAKFDRAGFPILREEGDGYRMQRGRGSVYLMPGQLEAVNEDGRTFLP